MLLNASERVFKLFWMLLNARHAPGSCVAGCWVQMFHDFSNVVSSGKISDAKKAMLNLRLNILSSFRGKDDAAAKDEL